MLAMMVLALAFVDEFDRLQGRVIEEAISTPQATVRPSLSFAEIGNLPTVLSDSRKAVLVIKTAEGNLARMVVSPAYRRSTVANAEPLPILLIERLDTMEAGPFTKRIAHRRDVVLFDRFLIDLDSGQVVPEGQGGDLQFEAAGASGPHLSPVGSTKLYTFTKSPLPDEPGRKPSSGRSVEATDFNGRFRLFANGQSSGTLDLSASPNGELTGRMFSDQTGNSYKLTGQVGDGSANRIRFAVDLPRTRQEFDGVLFSEGKAAITGFYTMQDRTFGFVAIREGGSLGVEDEDLLSLSQTESRPGRLVVEMLAAGVLVEGKPIEKDLGEVVREAVRKTPETWVLIRSAPDRPVAELLRIVELVKTAGVSRVGLAVRETPR